MSDAKTDVASSPHSLVITREFAAPKDLVFRAWTDQTLLARWSCPRGFVIEFGQMDLRPGGTWRCGMRAPDGTLHVARGEYREIHSPDLLEMTHGWENEQGQPGHVTRVTVELTESRGVTTMRFTQTGFKSVESRDGHRHGWTESFEKLGEQLKA